ncbi:H/ACA ribonucleoprotein complex subunit GAR1 [Natronobacterium gregoryi]|uniref:H/ACA RNA-protein complex component Gar1 n=2 Tax=Natronobacterium gregoryi TaxID=44930 RepID=L0AP83_NATGS|nr:Gar1/Naf1 family protein [Natronobacterium gregoryi]AFZ74915.1 RNA-binding protein involved in rRNA processing [Natronobacterium gregoryi SP2]ELY67393.1 H/ACA RNA-protein complex component Gar1 [Natronobacterium gregoryi SP2]PLK19843.1 H/ACA RNA-protein complex component Gar1 [Natronobacterium gregoryi SP2]SFJ39052.1 snoRNP protein GAR1 [Natronobacterium gregoryi]
MRRVGTVVRTAQGLAVLRTDDAADEDDHRQGIGTTVLDDSLEEVGRVVDVFGPVDRPYLAVTPNDDVHLPSLVGSTLYAR